jgi:tetratricopeptide (TPR) repeat protein
MTFRFRQKLVIPTAAHPLIERAALVDRLDQAINAKSVVVVAAPAGWGKTTLLAQWAAGGSLPVAWYSLDATDRDPQLFLDYLLHVVRPFLPDAGDFVERLEATAPSALSDLYRTVALAIAETSPPFALVLDDFHLIEGDAVPALPNTALIFTLLMSLIDYAPNCHLVVASRSLPELQGMVRVIAQQQAALFDYSELQLSSADVQRLAGLMTGRMLPDARADRLTSQLGGWVTGVVLSLDHARIEGRGRRDDEQRGDRLTSSPESSALVEADTVQVYAFFSEQTIAPLPPMLQCFLEDTSVLDSLSPQHCNALRGTNDSARLLEEVARRCLFVARRGGCLVYHSLFQEFLRSRLAQDPERERRLLRRAGDLYRDEESLDRAIECYLAANEREAAVEALRAAVPRLRQRSRQTTLLACFDRLAQGSGIRSQGLGELGLASDPRSLTPSLLPPDLLLAQARVLRDLALWERSYVSLQLAAITGTDEHEWEARIVEADTLQLQGDHTRALAVLEDIPVNRLPSRLQLSFYMTIGRVQVLSGLVDGAICSLEQAQALAPTIAEVAGDPSGLASIHDNLGWAYATRGDRQLALRHLQRADACWQTSGNGGRRAITLNNLATLAMEEGRYAEARDALTTALALAREVARRREEVMVLGSIAELDLVEGQAGRALEGFAAAHALASQIDLPLGMVTAATGALWSASLLGDVAAIDAWGQAAAAFPQPTQPETYGRLVLGRVLGDSQRVEHPHAPPELIQELSGIEPALQLTERAYLALLRAQVAFGSGGWAGAEAAWAAFELLAERLPDELNQHFVLAHRELFAAARPISKLVQRLVKSGAARWRITTLGKFECCVDGHPCTLSALHRALLARLLDAGPQGLTVERLWESVWGDGELSMPALHQALRRLRMYTHLEVVVREGSCSIVSPWDLIDYDVRTLERLFDGEPCYESVERIVALYGGDFLSSAPLSAAAWADGRRAYLQQRYFSTLEQFARAIEGEAPEKAIFYYQHILQLDGCREQTAVQLMRLAGRFGNRTLVTATFNHLTHALHSLGAAPDTATTMLYRNLR